MFVRRSIGKGGSKKNIEVGIHPESSKGRGFIFTIKKNKEGEREVKTFLFQIDFYEHVKYLPDNFRKWKSGFRVLVRQASLRKAIIDLNQRLEEKGALNSVKKIKVIELDVKKGVYVGDWKTVQKGVEMNAKVKKEKIDLSVELLKRIDSAIAIADDYVDLVRQEIELRKMEFEARTRQAQSNIVRNTELADMFKKVISFAMERMKKQDEEQLRNNAEFNKMIGFMKNEKLKKRKGKSGKKNTDSMSAKKSKKRKASA